MTEFATDLKNLYSNTFEEEEKIKDLIDEIKDIHYGFKDKITGKVYDNREWIHNCRDLGRYYEVQNDPRKTLEDKLGICTDQCLAIEYLMKTKYPELKPQCWALLRGRYGHCTLSFEDNGKHYYLENAWDKMKKDNKPTLYGPFESKENIKNFFKDIYTLAHEKDTDEDTNVITYQEYLGERYITESVIFWLK